MIKCPTCGKRNSNDHKFCGECGTDLSEAEMKCPNCGNIHTEGEKFCTQCGTKLVAEFDEEYVEIIPEGVDYSYYKASRSSVKWKECNNCGRQINEVAKKCPYCDYKFKL